MCAASRTLLLATGLFVVGYQLEAVENYTAGTAAAAHQYRNLDLWLQPAQHNSTSQAHWNCSHAHDKLAPWQLLDSL
jgi:hypothetical protein